MLFFILGLHIESKDHNRVKHWNFGDDQKGHNMKPKRALS
jgi:hypothetical protein